VSDDDTRHSGSRWEPTPASVPEKDVPAGDVPAQDEPDADGPADVPSVQAVDDAPAAAGSDNSRAAESGLPADETGPATERMALPAAHPAPEPWPVMLPALPLGGSLPPAPRRRNLRRAGLLAAVAAGLLAVGGAGGYAIGHAAAGSAPAGAAGLAGAPGEYGHHRGQFGADGGVPGDRDGGGSAGNDSVGDGTSGDGSVGRGRVGGTAPDGGGSTGTGTTGTGAGTAGTST
jgi:hypothetical protein